MKKLKKRVLYTLAFAGGDGWLKKEYTNFTLSEIYWRCDGFRKTSVRSILSVCLSEGFVARTVREGKSMYRLTTVGRESLQRVGWGGYSASTSEKKWIMVVLNEGVLSEDLVKRLNLGFKKLGLVSWSRGVWLTPMNTSESIKRYIISIGAAGAVLVVEAKKWYLGDEKSVVERLWKPLEYEVEVKNLISRAEPLLTTIRSLKSLTEPEKKRFLSVFDAWLSVMVRKPKLPQSLLPNGWSFDSGEKLILRLCESVLELERETRS